MHKLKSLALLALAGLGLSAYGGVTTNDWWDVPFTSPTAETDTTGYGGVNLIIGELGPLTNNWVGASVQQPYLSGLWTMVDGDESYVTNEFNPTNTWKAFGGDNCLKLDTQGNDLTWSNSVVMADGLKALVDADLYLVGSDSPPDASDFDSAKDVQTAIYLKNETDEDSGETTNSVLCVYVYNDSTEDNYWQELEVEGVELKDNAWAHVQVLVDHAEDATKPPTVQVFVNGQQMHARNGDATFWIAANGPDARSAGRVSSVAFRGTGAVDNFVGQTILETFSQAYFKAEVYLDGQITNELCQVTPDKLNIGGSTKASFTQFLWEEYDDDLDCAVYGLDKVEIIDFANGQTTTHSFDYNPDDGTITPQPTEGDVAFYGDGLAFFKVEAATAGAPVPTDPDEPVVIVKVYFKSANAKDAIATTTMDGTTTTNAVVVKALDFAEEGATKTVTWTFPAAQSGNVLSTIRVYNGASLEYANQTATVSVTLDEELADDTLFAAATYVTGTLAEGQDLRHDGGVDGLYTFEAYVPPVAMIGAVEYPSLRAAIAAAQPNDTIVMVADDHVSFTAATPKLVIEQAVTIDGGSNTLYGVSASGDDDWHEILVKGSGDVTIKNLAFTEFGDAATDIYVVYPICTSSTFTGKLTLDGVTFDKFARTALNLCGGTFEITNCVITGVADTSTADKFFQSAIETYFATGTVAATTVTGIGAKGYVDPDSGEDYCAAVFTLNSSSPGLPGAGKITVLSGDYSGQFVVAGMAESTGAVILSNGTFVATEPTTAEDPTSAFTFDGTGATLTIAGGWFDREPEAKYIAEGLAAKEVAPGTETPWTVGQTCAITFTVAGLEQPYFSTNVFSGETGYGPAEDPEKEATAGATFTFAGWTNAVAGGAVVATADLPAADGDATWAAVFTETANTFDITFMNEGAEFFATNVAYGATGYGPADAPEKAADAQYTYVFTGWTNAVGTSYATADLPAVEAEATYYATFSVVVRSYEVEWVVDGVYTTNTWNYNATPSWNENDATAVPTKDSTDATNFTFKAWTPEVAPVTGPGASYTATWTETVREYTITWSVDGTETTTQVAYGTVPAWTGEAPSKEGFTFLGWNSDSTASAALDPLPAVTGEAKYYAVFREDSGVVEVDAGDGLAQYKIDNPQADVPAPIEFTEPASAQETPLCQIAFVAPEAGTYVLLSSTTVNGTYTEDAGSAKTVAKGELTKLIESESSATGSKFFKIGYTK